MRYVSYKELHPIILYVYFPAKIPENGQATNAQTGIKKRPLQIPAAFLFVILFYRAFFVQSAALCHTGLIGRNLVSIERAQQVCIDRLAGVQVLVMAVCFAPVRGEAILLNDLPELLPPFLLVLTYDGVLGVLFRVLLDPAAVVVDGLYIIRGYLDSVETPADILIITHDLNLLSFLHVYYKTTYSVMSNHKTQFCVYNIISKLNFYI